MQTRTQAITKSIENVGLTCESAYGYVQAVRVGEVVYVSGQVSHDEACDLLGAAPTAAEGKVLDGSNMELRSTYAMPPGRLLQRFGAMLDNVIEKKIYAVDFDAEVAVAGT